MPGIPHMLPTQQTALGKGKDNETIPAAAKDPMAAVGSGLQLSPSYEQKFLPGPLQLLPKICEG